MVKFNPKQSRSTNKSPFYALANNTSLSVMVIATKVLFDVKLEDPKRNALYVHISPEDGRIPYRKTAMDIAYEVIGKIKKEGYTLFIDDNRTPTEPSAKNPGTCIVARNVAQAKAVVEKLGCPRKLYLDYSLTIYEDGETTMDFLDWFIPLFSQKDAVIPDDFGHVVISQHKDGPRLLERRMYEFYDVIWGTEEKV